MNATLYDRAKAAGLEMDHHESDLYLKDTPEARRVVAEHQAASGRDEFVTYFTSEIDGARWMDIAFKYEPFWAAKAARA